MRHHGMFGAPSLTELQKVVDTAQQEERYDHVSQQIGAKVIKLESKRAINQEEGETA